MKYLTTSQFRLADTGILTADITDLKLSSFIQDAEATIDAYMGFRLQDGGFELHRVWAQSAWTYETLRTRISTFPVPAQAIYGYKIQVSNISTAGSGFFATISPGDVVINVFEGYVEIVPLQAVTYSLSPVLLQLGLKPPLVQLEYLAGFYFPIFGEILLNSGDNKTYYAQRGFWATTYTQALHIQPLVLPPIPPVVYKNNVVQASGFTTNTTEGTVTFTAANLSTDTISLDYTYTIPDQVKQAAIARTTWLLGERLLAKQGMVGLQQAGMREQRVVRMMHPEFNNMIDPATANKLAGYKEIPVG